MQGYLDIVRVDWDEDHRMLSGASKIVGGDPYNIIIALNGYIPGAITSKDKETNTFSSLLDDGLIQLTLERSKNGTVEWSVFFDQ
jgi:hypothetical protein